MPGIFNTRNCESRLVLFRSAKGKFDKSREKFLNQTKAMQEGRRFRPFRSEAAGVIGGGIFRQMERFAQKVCNFRFAFPRDVWKNIFQNGGGGQNFAGESVRIVLNGGNIGRQFRVPVKQVRMNGKGSSGPESRQCALRGRAGVRRPEQGGCVPRNGSAGQGGGKNVRAKSDALHGRG